MKKVCFLNLLLIVILAACSNSPTEKANSLIKEDMPKRLVKADSYDPVETKLDSAFTPYDSPDFYNQIIETLKIWAEMQECKEKAKLAKSTMAIWDNPYSSTSSRNEYQESKAEYEECVEKQRSLEERVKKTLSRIRELVQKKSEFIGYKALHTYRASNNAGQTVFGKALYIFDKDFTKIIISYDMESEEYIAYEQAIKQIQEEVANSNTKNGQ